MESTENDNQVAAKPESRIEPSDAARQHLWTGTDVSELERDHDAQAPEPLKLRSDEYAPIVCNELFFLHFFNLLLAVCFA